MATLNLTTSEFADIITIFLFDSVMNPEQINNERFKEFINYNKSKIQASLIKYYLDSDSEKRLQYKRINGIFKGKDNSIQQIRIGPDKDIKDIEKKKDSIIKKVIKKIIKKESLTIEDENILREIVNEDY